MLRGGIQQAILLALPGSRLSNAFSQLRAEQEMIRPQTSVNTGSPAAIRRSNRRTVEGASTPGGELDVDPPIEVASATVRRHREAVQNIASSPPPPRYRRRHRQTEPTRSVGARTAFSGANRTAYQANSWVRGRNAGNTAAEDFVTAPINALATGDAVRIIKRFPKQIK